MVLLLFALTGAFLFFINGHTGIYWDDDSSYELEISPVSIVHMVDTETGDSVMTGLLVRSHKGYKLLAKGEFNGERVSFSEVDDIPHSGTVTIGDKVFTDRESRIPKDLDKLISFTLPEGFASDMIYHYNDDPHLPVVEEAFSDGEAYFSAAVFSYKDYDCLGDISQKVDYKKQLESLDDEWRFILKDNIVQGGMRESDDMPGMASEAYVKNGEYIFEFRMTNGDEQVTEWQKMAFDEILHTLKFSE